jgi:hypothetical protein
MARVIFTAVAKADIRHALRFTAERFGRTSLANTAHLTADYSSIRTSVLNRADPAGAVRIGIARDALIEPAVPIAFLGRAVGIGQAADAPTGRQ